MSLQMVSNTCLKATAPSMLTGLRAQGYFLSDDEAQQLLTKVDVDKSGYIDFDEFMATLVDWSEVGRHMCTLYMQQLFV